MSTKGIDKSHIVVYNSHSEGKMDNLVDAIKQKQGQQKISDKKLASLLGIHRTTWAYIKSGRRNPGIKFLSAVANTFPELRTLVDVEIYDNLATTPTLTHQDKQQGVLRKLLRGLYLWFKGSNRRNA